MSKLDTRAFERKLTAEGYTVLQKTLPPSQGLGDHVHDYDAWGLITAGEFHITVDGRTSSYRAGDEYRLEAGCIHSEGAGPEGASFIAGRRRT